MNNLNSRQFWKYPQVKTEQMPMFMTAREIKSTHAPLEGDRDEVDEWSDGDPIEADMTRPETDDELWERKTEEAEYSDRGYGPHDKSLYEDVVERGVQNPVHLQVRDPKEPRGPREDPRNQVVGGHHRIAVMGDARPDDLMPVLFHRSIFDAQGGIGFNPSRQRDRPYPYS